MDFSSIKIKFKKVRGNNIDLSTSKKAREKYVAISTSKITSQKVRGNNLNFSTSEITSKKARGKKRGFSLSPKLHRESTWKWLGNCPKFGF